MERKPIEEENESKRFPFVIAPKKGFFCTKIRSFKYEKGNQD